MNESNYMDHIKSNSRSSERILGYSTLASSLKADLLAVLHDYVGKRVLARHPQGSVSGPTQHAKGTIVNSFIEKDKAYVVVEWHLTASKTVIALQHFVQSGQFKVVEGGGGTSGGASSAGAVRPSPYQLKRRGIMKYTY